MAWGYGEPCPKPTPRLTTRIERKRERERLWSTRKAEVWKRDEGQCRLCGRKCLRTIALVPGRGEVHHIAPRSTAPERYYELSNLLLLCLLCHQKVTRHEIEVTAWRTTPPA